LRGKILEALNQDKKDPSEIEFKKEKVTRRHFLKLVGAAGTLATLATVIPFGKIFANSNNVTNNNHTESINQPIKQQLVNSHSYDLEGASPQFISPIGSRTLMNADNFPILQGMGAALLRLQKGGIREPHWHPNAAELSLCINGNAEITIFGNNAARDTFTIKSGDLTFVPKGYFHDIQNIGDVEAKFVIVYDSDRPETLGISSAVGSLSPRVLNRAFGISPTGLFDLLNYDSTREVTVGTKPVEDSGGNIPNTPNTHKFNLGSINPQLQTSGGTAALGSVSFFPILKGLACYLIRLEPSGIIEPHVHPNAAELNYVIGGKARFTVLSPGGEVQSSEVGQGQVIFVPTGYFHYIENPDPINRGEVASFFGNENPAFIGIAAGLGAYSNDVLSSVFEVDAKFFSALPRLKQNVFLASGSQ
jgi:oxalate decarboxylase